AIALFGAIITGGMVVNGVAIGAGVIFSYTMFRTIVTTIATDKIHTAYNHLEIQIITENPRELIDTILQKMGRGVTLSKVEGAYSTHQKTMIMVIISSYELQNIVDLLKEVDPKAFVIAKPVSRIVGNFKRKRIA
ncbi:MAG TPA: YitT family protein, partial [Bacteroidales bacterium]|nr:YitT family protein [Bacteroidales bacterium]